MQSFFIGEVGNKPGASDLVRDVVKAWFEQALVETVIGIQALQNSKMDSERH